MSLDETKKVSVENAVVKYLLEGQLIQKPGVLQTLAELDYELKAIPPTYAPPRSPPGGKPLTNRQKVMLAATILITIFIVMLLGLFLQHRV